MHRQWSQGHISWEVYRNGAHICGDKFRKTRAQVVLILARNGEINKGFYRFLVRKGRVKKYTYPQHTLKNKTGKTNDSGHGKGCSALQVFYSASVVIAKCCL